MAKGETHPRQLHEHKIPPAQQLAGAVLLAAVYDARRGDAQAARWLRRDATLWLELATPAGMEPGEVRTWFVEMTR